MPALASSSRGAAMDYFDLGTRQYGNGLYQEAAKSYERAIELGSRMPEAYENRARSLFKWGKELKDAYEAELHLPKDKRVMRDDGSVPINSAHVIAHSAVQKFDKIRWQPALLLAEILYHFKLYQKVYSLLNHVLKHQTFDPRHSTSKRVFQLRDKVVTDLRYIKQRVAGVNETERIRLDLEMESRIKRKTNYEHILTGDVLLLIFQMGSTKDPGLGCRMSRVNKRWRDLMISQPLVWSKLRLDKGKRTTSKVETYIQRARLREREVDNGSSIGTFDDYDDDDQQKGEIGYIKEIEITRDFDINKSSDIGKLLAPYVKHVEILKIESHNWSAILSFWRGLMKNLRVLHLINPSGVEIHSKSLDFDLLLPDTSGLTELKLQKVVLQPDIQTLGVNIVRWTETPESQLSKLKCLTLKDVRIRSTTPVESLVIHSPLLEEVELENIKITDMSHSTDHVITWRPPKEKHKETKIELRAMKKWVERNMEYRSNRREDIIEMPNLKWFEYYNPQLLYQDFSNAVLKTQSFQGFKNNLEVMDLGKNLIIDQNELYDCLCEMNNLRYLNLGFSNLTVDFLEKLSKVEKPRNVPDHDPAHVPTGSASQALKALHDEEKELLFLPNLVALCLAGNLELRAPTLRDIINSRLPIGEKIPTPRPSQDAQEKKKGGMFRARTSKPNQPPISYNLMRPSSQLASQAVICPNGQLPPTFPESKVKRLRWINIDHCENVDPVLFPALKTRVAFFSHWMGLPVVDERIRGSGKWDWELDWRVGCSVPGVVDVGEGCGPRANGNGKYYIWHICGMHQDVDVEEKGWGMTQGKVKEKEKEKDNKRRRVSG